MARERAEELAQCVVGLVLALRSRDLDFEVIPRLPEPQPIALDDAGEMPLRVCVLSFEPNKHKDHGTRDLRSGKPIARWGYAAAARLQT